MGFYSDKFKEDVTVLEMREYNGFNELTYLYRDTLETRYQYRPDGLRQKKLYADGTSTSHIYDGTEIVAEYGNNGAIHSRYLRGINLIAREQDNQLQYYLFNARSDVIERTDQNGTTLKRYDYDAWGNEKNPEQLDSNPYRFASEYYDRESETYYLRARSYDPRNSRMLSEDAVDHTLLGLPNGQKVVDPLSLNRYTYCNNNPIMYVDSSGNWPSLAQIATGLAIVAVTAVFVVAVVASAGAVGVVAAAAAGSLGASGAVMAGVSTVAVAGTYAVAGGIAVTGANRAAEAVTGENYLAETVFQGNYDAYNNTELALNIAGYGAVSIGATVPSPPRTSASRYTGQYDPSANFKKGTLLDDHYSRHGIEMGYKTAGQYAAGAEKFLLKDPTKTTLSFTSDMGWYFRYDMRTQEFGIINQYGGISTYYYKDYNYWLEQVRLYGPK